MTGSVQNSHHIQQNLPQVASGNSNPLRDRDVAYLGQTDLQTITKAYEKALSDYQELQLRMEGQVQQKEVALFKTAHQNVKLLRDLADATRREGDLKTRINALNEDLAAARNLNIGFGDQVRNLQAQQALLQADLENARREKADSQRGVEGLVNRNKAQLEVNITLQREVDAVRRLPGLEKQLKVLDKKRSINLMEQTVTVGSRTVAPIGISAAVTWLTMPFLGPLAFYLGASSGTAYTIYRASNLEPEELVVEGHVINGQRLDICYQIIELRKGITKADFLSKPEDEKNQILSELGLA